MTVVIESSNLRRCLQSCHCGAAAGAASSRWTSSCLCSACSGTTPGSPAGWGRSSPPAAPSSARPASGSRCSRSATCAAASRSAPSGPESSSPTACGRGSDAGPAAPRPDLLSPEGKTSETGGKKKAFQTLKEWIIYIILCYILDSCLVKYLVVFQERTTNVIWIKSIKIYFALIWQRNVSI